MTSYLAQGLPEIKLVLVGKTGAGKSSLANTLLGVEWFNPIRSSSPGTDACQSTTKEVMNTQLTVVDTPGLTDTEKSEEDLKSEIIRSIVESSPGPHVFLIVLRVETYTKHEEEVLKRICDYVNEDVLKYSVIVFTYGDQLKRGTAIKYFVVQNQKLNYLVRKCGGRCHVFDSKYWKNDDDPEKYRRNSYQLKDLFNTLERLVNSNNGGFYTNDMLQEVQTQIERAEESIRRSESEGDVSTQEIEKRAKDDVIQRLLTRLTGVGSEALFGAFYGVKNEIVKISTVMKTTTKDQEVVSRAPTSGIYSLFRCCDNSNNS